MKMAVRHQHPAKRPRWRARDSIVADSLRRPRARRGTSAAGQILSQNRPTTVTGSSAFRI